MAISGLSGAGAYTPSQSPLQSSGPHKHGRHHSQSISDVDAQSSSVATPASSTGKIGSKIDITV